MTIVWSDRKAEVIVALPGFELSLSSFWLSHTADVVWHVRLFTIREHEKVA